MSSELFEKIGASFSLLQASYNTFRNDALYLFASDFKSVNSLNELIKKANENDLEAILNLVAIYLDKHSQFYDKKKAKPWLVKAVGFEQTDKSDIYQIYFDSYPEERNPESLVQVFGESIGGVDWFLLGNAQLAAYYTQQQNNFKLQNAFKDISLYLNNPKQKRDRIQRALPFFIRAALAGDKDSVVVIQKLLGDVASPLEKILLLVAGIPKDRQLSEIVYWLPESTWNSVSPELRNQINNPHFKGHIFYQLISLGFKENNFQMDGLIRSLVDKAPENALINSVKILIADQDKKIEPTRHRLEDILNTYERPNWFESIVAWFESALAWFGFFTTQQTSDKAAQDLRQLCYKKIDEEPDQQQAKIQTEIEKALSNESNLSYRLSVRLKNFLSDMQSMTQKNSQLLPALPDPIPASEKINPNIWHPIFSEVEIFEETVSKTVTPRNSYV